MTIAEMATALTSLCRHYDALRDPRRRQLVLLGLRHRSAELRLELARREMESAQQDYDAQSAGVRDAFVEAAPLLASVSHEAVRFGAGA